MQNSVQNAWDEGSSPPLRKKVVPVEANANWRVITLRDSQLNQSMFCDNLIVTSKYHVWNFLPLNLFEQFRRLANFYFLCIAVLQAIPNISPVDPWTSILPLVFVLGVSALKEAREDYHRHVQDTETNMRKTLIYNPATSSFQRCVWADVTVGSIIRVRDDEAIPADILIIKSSLENSICYIETSNLDGETNLKIRGAHPSTHELLNNNNDDRSQVIPAIIECEHPNSALYKFEGNLKLPSTNIIPLEIKQILLRGCVLRNTNWIDGIVIFTGHDTKLMMNSMSSKIKTSSIERNLNRNIISLFGFLIILCVICGGLSGDFLSNNKEKLWYLGYRSSDKPFQSGALSILTYVILFNTLIPISLYVSIELVKVVQAFLIDCDVNMYDPLSNTPAKARTSNLTDELGEIQYIFSDKTGTLTQNIMEFKMCSIAGMMYGSISSNPISKEYQFEDPRIFDIIRNSQDPEHFNVSEFIRFLSLCSTVLPVKDDQDPHNLAKITYQAASPDEAALLNGARYFGYILKSRSPGCITITTPTQDETWTILSIIEFSSQRKRMSIILRSPKGQIILICKGADTVILPRLGPNQQKIISTTVQHMESFATIGLRTLCMSSKELTEEEYSKWQVQYNNALTATSKRDEKVEECGDLIENNLILHGATAIEDKLQEGVSDCIYSLRQAGIKIWILTGDKQETAINIGYSCKLIDREMNLMILNGKTPTEAEQQIDKHIKDLATADTDALKLRTQLGLVIDGQCLSFAINQFPQKFVKLAVACKSVICSRVSPSQKGSVVKLIVDNLSATTLAIGDGANDVGMIKQAHIGVGISGQEGMQAVMASDYAIAQFRFLKTLLLIHGRWSYVRICQLVRYCFYKNICFSLISLWFSIYTGFSGQTLHESMYIALFNVIFTSLPIMVLAVFEQDVSPEAMDKYPQLYSYRQETDRFDPKSFWTWLVNGLVHSVICFYIPYAICMKTTTIMPDGTSGVDGIWSLGTLTYTCVVVLANIKVGLMTTYWTWIHLFCCVGSVFAWFLFALAYHSILLPTTMDTYGVIFWIGGAPMFWLCIIFVPLLAITLDFIIMSFYNEVRPSNILAIRENMRKSPKSCELSPLSNVLIPSQPATASSSSATAPTMMPVEHRKNPDEVVVFLHKGSPEMGLSAVEESDTILNTAVRP